MNLTFRQGIVKSLTNSNQAAAFLTASGSTVNILTEGIPVLITAAYQTADYLVQIPTDVPNAWGPFQWNPMWGLQPTQTNYFMYWDINVANGLVTRAYTPRQPFYGQIAPSQPLDDQHWFDTNNNVMYVWNGMTWVQKIRVFAGCVSSQNGLITYSFGSQVGISSGTPIYNAGYILYGPDQKAVKTSSGLLVSSTTDISTYIGNFSSPVQLELLATDSIAMEPIPAYYAVTISGNAQINLAQPNDNSTRAVGLAATDCIEGQTTKIITHGAVYNDQWNWDITLGKDLYLGENGTLYQSLTTPTSAGTQRVATILATNAVIVDIDTYSGNGTSTTAASSLYRIVTTAAATYDLTPTDLTGTTWLRMASATANSVVLTDAVNNAVPVGSFIKIRQAGAGTTTIIAAGSDISILPPTMLTSSAQYTTFTLVKVDAQTWDIENDLSTNSPTPTLSVLSVNDITVTPIITVVTTPSVISINDITVVPVVISGGLPVVAINDVTVVPAIVSGGGTTSGYYSTAGNQIIDSVGNNVRLKSVNWFGGEGTNYIPNGLWQVSYQSLLDDIASMGFNTIRMPISGDTFTTGQVAGGINTAVNASFTTDGTTPKTVVEIFDIIVNYAGELGLKIIFDHHQQTAAGQKDGQPFGGSGSAYTEQDWINTWTYIATHYGTNPTVIGADLHNEPYNLTWAEWSSQAATCAAAIQAIAPDWLIIVEGVGTSATGASYWWGGQLADVANAPLTLTTVPHKLVYSPHEYGQSVGTQSWLATDSTPVTNYPHNLYDVWTAAWGFIFENNIGPIWVGEFGGKFGVDGSGAEDPTYAPNSSEEILWLNNLMKYMNGDFTGSGTSQLSGSEQGISFSYWCYNPNSGDTGGLVEDDWVTHQTVKLDLLQNGGLITPVTITPPSS